VKRHGEDAIVSLKPNVLVALPIRLEFRLL
jgi:hypothetical protein